MRKLLYLLPLLVAYFATGIAKIESQERGVVRRFGRIVARPGPGLWVGWPWGIDRIDRVPLLTVRQINVGYQPDVGYESGPTAGQLLTGDQNLVNVKLVVEYAVRDSESNLEDYILNRDMVDAVLAREAETLATEWASRNGVDAVLAGRTELTQYLFKHLPDRLERYRFGIAVQRISVDYLAAPEEVRDAFEAVNQAQTNVQTRVNQASREAERLRSEARSTEVRLLSEANGYREEKLQLARSEADAFSKRVEQYHKLREANPDFLAAIWRDELGKLLTELKSKGRIEILDHYLGAAGLDITQFLPVKKR